MSGLFFPARSPPSVGLDNVGNSCYINSVVQSLYLTDTFRSRILALRLTPAEMKQFGTLRALQHTFAMLNYCTRDRYTPRAFACEMPSRFNSGQQQDADEYAKYLLDTVGGSMAQLAKQRQAAMKRKVEDIAAEPSQREEKKCDVKREERIEAVNEEQQHGKIKGGAQTLTMPNTFAHKAVASSPLVQRNNSTVPPTASSSTSTSSAPSPGTAVVPSQSSFSSPLPSSPLDVDPYFGGLSSSCLACLRCGSVSKKAEAFLELPLPMQQMDEEQRCALIEKIEQVRQAAELGQTIDKEEKDDVEMKPEQPRKQSSDDSIFRTSAGPTLPLAVLAKIAAFSSPLQTTSKALRSSSASAPQSSSHPAVPPKPTPPTPAAFAPVSEPLPATNSGSGSSRELPLDVLARIAEFAAVRPKAQPAVSTSHQAGQTPADTKAKRGVSSSGSPTSPSISSTATSEGHASSMQDSSAPSLVSSSSASVSVPSSSSHSSSSANAFLAAFLAQAVLQMQAAAAVTALSTVAAAAQKVREQQLEAAVDKAAKGDNLMDIDDDSGQASKQEEECTALVLYAPPPHKPLPPSDHPTTDSQTATHNGTTSASTALILASSQSGANQSSDSASTSSSPSLLQLSAMLALYLAPELLTGENAYHCSHCQSKQPATKTLTITQPPPHLMLCLKRNSYNKTTHSRNKITTEVKFPALLTLPTAAGQAGAGGLAVYGLYSVVVHGGVSADSGHYWAVGRWSGELRRRMRVEVQRRVDEGGGGDASRKVRPGDWVRYERELEESARCGEWWTMNDHSVTSASFTTIAQLTKRCATDVAYLLLYVRVDDEDEQEALGEGGACRGGVVSGECNDVLTVNPLLERLAVMEQQIWVKQQEKAAKEALASVMQRLPKLPDYKPPPADYVDPDM